MGRFSMLDIFPVGVGLVRTRSAMQTSPCELHDVLFSVGTLLVLEQSSLEDRPRGAIVLYTPSYALVPYITPTKIHLSPDRHTGILDDVPSPPLRCPLSAIGAERPALIPAVVGHMIPSMTYGT